MRWGVLSSALTSAAGAEQLNPSREAVCQALATPHSNHAFQVGGFLKGQ